MLTVSKAPRHGTRNFEAGSHHRSFQRGSTQRTFKLPTGSTSFSALGKCVVLVYDSLRDYLSSINLFSLRQHDFGKGCSLIIDLLTAVEECATVLDLKGKVRVTHLDFSEAFESFSHLFIVDKVNRLGIKSPLIDWPTSYLNN